MSDLFGGGAATSLTESIFGAASSSNTNSDLFAKPAAHQHQPPPKRPRKSGSGKGSEQLFQEQEPPEKSRDETLNERRRQSQAKILDQLTLSLNDYKSGGRSASDNDELYGDVRGLMRQHGLVILRDALTDKEVAKISKIANSTQRNICDALDSKHIPYNSPINNTESVCFRELAIRCQGRMDVRYCDDTTSNNKKLPSLSLIDNLAASVLHGAEEPKKVYAGWIFSFPNSDDQPWHQDGSPLFEKGTEDLPSYAINVFCGLHDTQILELGPTEFVVGSHHMDAETAMEKIGDEVVSAVLGKGDILLYDYRICHRGTSNISTAASGDGTGLIRKVLYLMYARPWFREHLNFGDESLFE